MIKVNGRDFKWEEGMTIEKLLEKKRYTFSKIIVRVNGVLIKKEAWTDTIINDGDDVKAIHVFAGG
ncbi:sulfur carrier protein ThiS [Wukongibacter sp. M2B1]|uniref:sulfur carrier protein ThiS n=1 Tax=Wukongibacter sp. M2B1 TaxID=3088895 RepID=UPI003D7A95D9